MEKEITIMKNDRLTPKLWFSRSADYLQKLTVRRPVVVGVFQDQTGNAATTTTDTTTTTRL